ncbi:ABC transporter permease [Spirochaeta dissipatitropha]
MKAFGTFFAVEARLALRGGDMLIFGIIMPVVIMLLMGSISDAQATQTAFAGIAGIGIIAAGLMGLPLTFAGYRHGKILKRMQVTPASPFLLFAAASLVQTIFAWISGFLVLLIASLLFSVEIHGGILRYVLSFLFLQCSIFSIGYMVAALVPDIKTANWVCTLLYFPMLLFSGATIPYAILPRGLQRFAEFFPLTQGIQLLQGAVAGTDITDDYSRIIALAIITGISCVLSLIFFRWE